jgi:hypothetical protein
VSCSFAGLLNFLIAASRFPPQQANGAAAAGIFGAAHPSAIVLVQALFQVAGDAGIETAIGAFQDIDLPVCHWRSLR